MQYKSDDLIFRVIDHVQVLMDSALDDRDEFDSSYVLGKITGLVDLDSFLRKLLHELREVRSCD